MDHRKINTYNSLYYYHFSSFNIRTINIPFIVYKMSEKKAQLTAVTQMRWTDKPKLGVMAKMPET